MPWIKLRITKRIPKGGTTKMVKCVTQVVRLKGELFQEKVNDAWVKPHPGGVTI